MKSSRRTAWRSTAGFTMFEALVAIALMGLVLGARASVTGEWLPPWNRGLLQTQRNEQVAIALDRLAADLSAAEFVMADRTSNAVLFRGDEAAVTFVRSALGPNNLPGSRHAPFSSVDELSLVLGLSAALLEQVRPYLTVYSGTAGINVLEAAPQVIAALPEMTSAKLDAFLNQRDSLPPNDPEFVLGALGGRVAGATVAGSDAYRVRMQIILPDGRKSTSEGVIMLPGPGAKMAYRVFTWRDEIDPATGAVQR